MDSGTSFLLGIGVALGGLLLLWMLLRVLRPWIIARASGIPLAILDIIGMRFRGSSPDTIVEALVVFTKMGESVPTALVEAAYLSLPAGERTGINLIRAARPDVMARLEEMKRARERGDAA